MTWRPDLDWEFNETFSVVDDAERFAMKSNLKWVEVDDAERFAMTSPRKREPLTRSEWLIAICLLGTTLFWTAFLCLAGYGLFRFVWDLGVKLFHR